MTIEEVTRVATSVPSYTTDSGHCQQSTDAILTRLHADHRLRFVRFSTSKIPFDPRHRTWGLELDALLRTHANPDLHVGWIPASVGLTVVDVDSGDWRQIVEKFPPAFHAPSRTPGRRHLVYRDTEARADVNGWQAEGCTGDVRSAGPVILYDAHRLLVALDIGVKGVAFPTSTFRRLPEETDEANRTKANPPQERDTAEGNPIPPSQSPRGGDKVPVTGSLPLPAQESSQPQSLFDRLRHWAYSPCRGRRRA